MASKAEMVCSRASSIVEMASSRFVLFLCHVQLIYSGLKFRKGIFNITR